jgi:toxin-antitoxin system PIN domain toxin
LIAVDTNLLVYAHRPEGPFHEAAAAALVELATGASPWGLPWSVVHEFLHVVTHPRVFADPTPLAVAADAVEEWLASPSVVPLAEPAGYFAIFRGAAESARVRGTGIYDARIAAVCLTHGVRELWTADRDFGRFPGLRTKNPVVGTP